jgi:hypothetical protein
VHLGGLSPSHAPGEHVVYIRSSGPVPFGERGVVVAVQGTKCEVLFEREGYCGTGHFAQLRSCRGAVLPNAALLNLSRPLPAAYRLSVSAGHGGAAVGFGVLSGGGGTAGAPLGGGGLASMRRQHAGLPANIWTLLEAEDAELREPEWLPTVPSGSSGATDFITGAIDGMADGSTVVRGGSGKQARRRAARDAVAEAALLAAEIDS